MTTVLFWDIDGTLLTTARAGIAAWEKALKEVLGVEVNLETYATAGLTDPQIARSLASHVGHVPDLGTVSAMLRVYERDLPSALPLRQGQVLPGVFDALDAIAPCADVLSMLLTGNTRAGAAAKLGHYGLSSYFEHGAYGDDGEDRHSVARHAWEVAREVVGNDLSVERAYVIGDTPHDVACGTTIGVRTVAVASSTSTVDELRAAGAWVALECIPEPGRLGELLGLTLERKACSL